MNIIDAYWFDNIGVVMVEDPYDGIKYYIGSGNGFTEEADRYHIAKWGLSFPKDAGDALFPHRKQTVSRLGA